MQKITRAQVSLVELRLDKPVGGSGVASVDVIVVDLNDDEGHAGLGFSYVLGGGGDVVLQSARYQLDRFVCGREISHPRSVWETLAATFNRTGNGPNLIALAAIDLAVWDIYSNNLGVSLGIALGGTPRAVPLYGSGGFNASQDAREAAEVAEKYAKQGLRAVKPRVQGSVSRDSEILAAVRRAVGDDVAMMVDANERCDLPKARELVRLALDHGVLFVEEPLPAHALAAYRTLSSRTPVAIATGEHLQALTDFLPYLSEGIVDVIQPDLAMAGGITPIMKLCTLAEAFGVAVSPHFLPGLFVHAAAASSAIQQLEHFPLIEPLFDGWPTCDAQGRMAPAAESGHGLRLRRTR